MREHLGDIFNDTTLWQMSLSEKLAIFNLFDNMPRKKVAIEIGSYRGGFLKHLSKYFEKVYSCDINHAFINNKDQYKNVIWIEGDSAKTVPLLIQQIVEDGEEIDFVLVDGDHSFEAVITDINNVLSYKPISTDMILLMHDSWYDGTRKAINKANWRQNPYVIYVEKDLVPGDIVNSDEGNIYVGGLAIAILSNKKRLDSFIEIKQSHDYMYRVVEKMLREGKNI